MNGRSPRLAAPALPLDLLRWLGVVAVFVALPLVLLVTGLERAIEEEFRPVLARRTADLEGWLDQFRHTPYPEMGLEHWLGALENRVDTVAGPWLPMLRQALGMGLPGLPGSTLFDLLEPDLVCEPLFLALCEVWLPDLQRTYPGAFEFVVFDHRRRLVERLSTPELIAGRQADWEAFWQRRFLWRERKAGALADEIERWRALLGPLVSDHPDQLFRLATGGRFQVGFHPRRQLLVLPYPRARRPLVGAFLSVTPDWAAIGPCLGVLAGFTHLEGGDWGLIDLRWPEHEWEKGFGRPPPGLATAVIALGRAERQALLVEDRWWAQRILTPHHRLLVTIPDPVAAWRRQERYRLRWIAVGLGLLMAGGCFPFLVGRPPRALSLRWKLVLLFLYAAGVPLALLASATGSLLQEQRAVRIRDRHDRQERRLAALDRHFLEFFAARSRGLRRGLAGPVPADWSIDHPGLRQHLLELHQQFRPDLCLVFDEQGRVRAVAQPGWESVNQSMVDGMRAAMAPLMARAIADENGQETDVAGTVKDQLVKSSAESLGIDMERVVAVMRRRLDRLSEQTLLSPAMGGCFRWRAADGRVRFLVMMAWMQAGQEPFYLREAIPACQRRFPDTVFQISPGTADQARLDDRFRWRTDPLSTGLLTQAAPLRLEFEEGGRVWLLTGIKGQFLRQTALFAISSDQEIVAADRALIWRVGISGGIILGLVLTLGFLVARRLLLPLGDLGRGLAAVQARKFRTYLPVRSRDELGRMIETFNGMLESLEGLEVGRAIQEALFPARPLVAEGWSLFGATVPASRVGGDYFDYFPLPDGRWFLTIGDVSGHGVSAALVVGLAKGVVAHPDTPRAEPEQVLDLLNQVIQGTLARRKTMTCQVGVFDPRTGRLVLSNAGHCRPFLVGESGVEELVMGGRVIGFKTGKGQMFPVYERSLTAGEMVVFYSDGLVEAPVAGSAEAVGRDDAGQAESVTDQAGSTGEATREVVVGYSRLVTALSALRQAEAAATAGAIRAWLTELTGGAELPDDVTIMVLQGPAAGRAAQASGAAG
jgi:serine phosphatase RsbU (regulator of sigma subunit)